MKTTPLDIAQVIHGLLVIVDQLHRDTYPAGTSSDWKQQRDARVMIGILGHPELAGTPNPTFARNREEANPDPVLPAEMGQKIKGMGFKVYPDCKSENTLIPREPNPDPVLPAGLPPLPPGTRYAGQLKDHEGRIEGWIYVEADPASEGWEYSTLLRWRGMRDNPTGDGALWHLAVPVLPQPIADSQIPA